MKYSLFYRLILLLSLCFSIILPAKAQKYQFPDESGAFLTYVQDMLEKTNRENCKNTADALGTAWSKLSSSNKTKVIEISKKMIKKRATVASMYNDFYASVANAANLQNIGSSKIDEYLDVTDAVVEHYNAREILKYLEVFMEFFRSKSMHTSRTSAFYGIGPYEIKFLKDPDENLKKAYAPVVEAEGTPVPDISGPIIKFSNSDFIIATKYDSTGIQKTQGVFMVIQEKLIGKGGKFDWSSVGLDPSQVYVEFDNYVLDVSKPVIAAQNVQLKYTLLLNRQISGDFEFVSRPRKDEYSARFPKFVSAYNNVEIQQFAKDLSYKGGFSLEGRNISTQARNPGLLSTFTGEKDGMPAFRMTSSRFELGDSIITSPSSQFALYLGESDSMYHGALQVKYYKDNRKILLVRDRNSSVADMPYVNNHHEFYISADILTYDLEKDSMDIYMLSGAQNIRPATFESFDYFNEDRYNMMRSGMLDFHPLKIFTRYAASDSTNAREFYVEDVARKYRKNPGILKNVAISMRNQGFLQYDDNTGLIKLNQRINKNDSTDLFLRSAERINAEKGKSLDSTIYNTFDHDNFIITSYVSSSDVPNASLNRSNNELLIRGIEEFPMSEKLGVYIRPYPETPDSTAADSANIDDREITVYGGRNLYMKKGEITVGKFRFIGEQFFLLYDQFSLEMPIINQILFMVQDTVTEEQAFHEYGGEINFRAGNMLINDELNKSGIKQGVRPNGEGDKDVFEAFPKLFIPEGGEVYFATEYRQKFAYDSTKAVFKLDPIDMDSLNIKVPIFPGTFESNIFPAFQEKLVPMNYPDTTMGFVHTPPEAGYDLYPNYGNIKGAHIKFDRELVMDAYGLHSGGNISYLTTKLDAPEYVFMPDSVSADNIVFNIGGGQIAGADFAEASGRNAQLRWYTTDDRMYISNKEEMEKLEAAKATLAEGAFEQRYQEKLFTLYKSKEPASFKGNLTVRSTGLTGEGNLIRKDFTILSVSEEPFKFGQSRFTADNVDIKINSKERDPFKYDRAGTFYTNDKEVLRGNFVNLDLDLAAGSAVIKPNPEFGDFTALALPYAEYRTSIKEAVWNLKKQTITMSGDSTSRFSSTIFGGDELSEKDLTFRATDAFYDIPNLTLLVDGVPSIKTADALIIPDKGTATILKDAEMQELKKARILIDTLNRYHSLFDGNIRIKSRLEFEGDATYQFVNVQKDTFNIKFDEFELVELTDEEAKAQGRKKAKKNRRQDKDYIPRYTKSQGTVTEEDQFYITSRILYKGLVTMYATREDLELDGFIRLDLSTRTDYNNWIPYKSDKGDSVVLAIDSETTIGTDKITSGLHFVPSTNEFYTTFLSTKKNPQDLDVFLANGTLDYNPSINEFKISPDSRRSGETFTGNRLIFDDSKGNIFVEGKFKLLDENLSQYAQMAGSGRINVNENIYRTEVLMPLGIPIGGKSLKALQEEIVLKGIVEKPILLQKNSRENARIAEIAGDKAVRKYIEDITVKPVSLPTISRDLNKPIVLYNVNLEWSEEYKTLHSTGLIRLMSIGEKTYDIEVPGFVEIRKNVNGDAMSIYLQLDPDLWLFFEIEPGGVVTGLSSSTLVSDELSGDMELAGVDKKEAFIAKFRAIYGADELPQPKEKPKEETPKEEGTEEEEDDDGF